jgi:hypothetical protein
MMCVLPDTPIDDVHDKIQHFIDSGWYWLAHATERACPCVYEILCSEWGRKFV